MLQSKTDESVSPTAFLWMAYLPHRYFSRCTTFLCKPSPLERLIEIDPICSMYATSGSLGSCLRVLNASMTGGVLRKCGPISLI